MPKITEKPRKIREFARSKRAKSRDKENPDASSFFDFNFTSPTVQARENRPRASELHPTRLVPYSDSESSQNSSSTSISSNSSAENDHEFVFAAAIDPYGGSNKPKLSGYDRFEAIQYQGSTVRKRIEASVRHKHPTHAAYLDATDTWKTNCFIKGEFELRQGCSIAFLGHF